MSNTNLTPDQIEALESWTHEYYSYNTDNPVAEYVATCGYGEHRKDIKNKLTQYITANFDLSNINPQSLTDSIEAAAKFNFEALVSLGVMTNYRTDENVLLYCDCGEIEVFNDDGDAVISYLPMNDVIWQLLPDDAKIEDLLNQLERENNQ
jgi:hypothetical protein